MLFSEREAMYAVRGSVRCVREGRYVEREAMLCEKGKLCFLRKGSYAV
jgi:hypothetical protein